MSDRTLVTGTLPLLVTAVGVVALSASLVVHRPAPTEAPVAKVPAVEIPAVELELPPGVVDATDSGIIFRHRLGVGLSIELVPDQPATDGLVLTTRGPLTATQLDAIRDSRPEADLIHVYAYDPTLPSRAPRARPGDVVVHQFTPEQGWRTLPPNRPVIRRPPPYRPENLRPGPRPR